MSILDPHPHTRFSPKLAFGLVLMAIGGILLLERLDLLQWRHLAWWPSIFFLLGAAMLWRHGFVRTFWGHAFLAFGTVGLAGEFGREDLVEKFWPLAVVWIGFILVLRALLPKPRPCCPGPAGLDEHLEQASSEPVPRQESTPDFPRSEPGSPS